MIPEHLFRFAYRHSFYVGHYYSFAMACVYIQSFKCANHYEHSHYNHGYDVYPEESIGLERKKFFYRHNYKLLMRTKILFSLHSITDFHRVFKKAYQNPLFWFSTLRLIP
ncbi:hypothetical protein M084_0423 [Bacteroides fragilis str. 3988 T1]|uniref:Uncharacterized protein n=7 Tax=Bacteroides fragilis TaxID=817 RepID=A0A015W2I5_BACFG|nr:hypothetical protein M077_0449 [Bacteroides fragilis str. 2-F-2 \